MSDSDRAAWPAGLDDELTAHLWAGGLTADDDPSVSEVSGGLISLAFIWDALRRRAWLWCVTAVLGLVIGTGLYLRYPPAYHAQASVLLVDGPNQDPATQVLTDQALAQSEPVAARVVQQLGLPQSAASLRAAYSVTPITNTVLQFSIGAPSGAAAVQRASALVASYLQYRAKYAQTQAQQEIAQLGRQYGAAEQSVQQLDGQIGQLPTSQLTSAQKIQLDRLQTQLADQKQVMQYATGTIAATKTYTASMVAGSYVLNPPVLLAHSRLKGAALYVAGGLFGGLFVGMGVVIVAALLSGRLRRRDDVAAALGAPVKLSVGRLRAPGRRPALPREAARRERDMRRLAGHLRAAVPAGSRGPASLAVVAVDDPRAIAPALVSLARSRAEAGGRVVLADLCAGLPLARLLGVRDPGVHQVGQDGGRVLVAVPGRDDAAPVGPVPGAGAPAGWGAPDAALVAAYSTADLLLTLVTLDPALGGDHLATWASDAIVVVTAGRSSVEKVHSAGEMVRLAGTRIDSAVLIGADRSDASLGVTDPAYPLGGGAAAAAAPGHNGNGRPH